MKMIAENISSDTPLAQAYRMERRMLGWNTPDDYMSYVDPYWKSFEAPNPYAHYMLGFLYIILTICSLIGNGVVVWIFTTTKSLRTPSNMLVVTLAIFDFIQMFKTPVFIVNSFNEGPIFGKLGCQIYGVLGAYGGVGSSATNAAIAFDRYRAIANPMDGKLSKKTVLCIILFIWLYATPWALMPFFEVWGRFVPEGYLTTCTFDYLTDTQETRLFVGAIFFFAFCIPFSVLVFFYSKIVGKVRHHEKVLQDQAKKMNVTSLRSNKDHNETSAEVRIAKVAISLSIFFVLSWGPYAVIALTAAFGDRTILTPFSSMIPACTCKTSCCISPWIYAINHPRYRLELQKRMPWFCVHEPEPETATQKSLETTSTATE